MSDLGKIPDDALIVIPARYESSRLPGKPLIDLAGKPMIVRTAEQCLKVANQSQVVVATDDQRIAEVCREFDVRCELTDSKHQTGSDRVAEVASRISAGVYLNVQGDEPVFNPRDIIVLVNRFERESRTTLIGYCEMSEDEWSDSKNIKLLFGQSNQLIYIGRAKVPGSHNGEFRVGFRQVCIYGYSADVLREFSSTGVRTPLESIEDNEVMRFLELGMQVDVVKLSDDSISVDRPSDVDRVLARLAQK